MSKDYRTFLKAIGREPVAQVKLRTVRTPGSVEIVRERGEYRLHRYGEPAVPREGRRYRQWRASRRLLED